MTKLRFQKAVTVLPWALISCVFLLLATEPISVWASRQPFVGDNEWVEGRDRNGSGSCSSCQGQLVSPILIDVSGDGFDLTDAASGVEFDLEGTGTVQRWSWTSEDSDDAWLSLDRNGNGFVDSGQELFGDFTPQPTSSEPNGFMALAEYDEPALGGNDDGLLNEADAIFTSLRLWQDQNHNGMSEVEELHSLRELGLTSIDLDYKKSRREDQYGNQFRYRAKVGAMRGVHTGRWAWDVFLISGS